MGTDDTFRFPSIDKDFSPEDLSADVLKTLKGYVRNENVNAAVITIPAAFSQTQVEATQKAAELAGFKQIELIPEPLAASLAYGIEQKNTQGYWLVL
jgi:molecular chaperone DnaK